jgi:UDP-N-acetylglucosamine 2-epimerase (non-hydrolysing)
MRIDIVFGTRPELIKLFPVIQALKKSSHFSVRTINTGQHREMLDMLLPWFEIQPDVTLALMKDRPGLDSLTATALTELTAAYQTDRPDLVLVQGDTTTAFAAALAAFYLKIPVGHVEAGLRTFNKLSPWPEEINRTFIGKIADLHFAPTALSQSYLLKESVASERIFVTGNTVIDALQYSVEKLHLSNSFPESLKEYFSGDQKNSKLVLITGHRRENFGKGFESICWAIRKLAEKFPDVHFIYPVHLNPNVQAPVSAILGKALSQNIKLVEPLSYQEFVRLMQRAYIILTDSGGVQEEGPSLGKPVLVMRNTTERPEGVEAGSVRLTGTNEEAIISAVSQLLDNEASYKLMSQTSNPYGDGKAAVRIVEAIEKHYA